MASKKYTIKYTATFISQFNNILKYFIQGEKNGFRTIKKKSRRISSST